MNKINIPFISNIGQLASEVNFYAQTFGGTVFTTDDGAIHYLFSTTTSTSGVFPERENVEVNPAKKVALTEKFVGAKVKNITGEHNAETHFNYLKGNQRPGRFTNIPAFDQLSFHEIYPGITFKLRAYANNVEKLFYLQPGAEPRSIRLQFDGADKIRVTEGGALEIVTEAGVISFTQPLAYQSLSSDETVKTSVPVAYFVEGNEYSFVLGEYDKSRTVVIDPLIASTLLGGSNQDGLNYTDVNLALDKNGNVLISGPTNSPDFPVTAGVYSDDYNNLNDVFVARISNDLTTLEACTYIGGNGNDETRAIAVDETGNIYLAGITESNDFPTSSSAYQKTYRGGTAGPYGSGDIFISKLDNDLQTLLASTYLGGTSHECCSALCLDADGNVFVTGGSASLNFPTTSNSYQPTHKVGGQLGYDIYIAKLNATLSSLLASTFIGGTADDFSEAMVIDSAGNVCIGGWVSSSNYPTSVGAYDKYFNSGVYDGCVSKLSNDLSSLIASTYLGGTAWDFIYGMALDDKDNIFVTGHTASANFPTSNNAFDRTYSGQGGQGVGDDVFISKLNSALTTLFASTYLGGSAWENGYGLAVDKNGFIYGTGTTSSANFPTTTDAFDTTYGGGTRYTGDVYITRLNNDLSTLTASTYLGGNGNEGSGTIFLDVQGNVYFGGSTSSANFPTTAGAYDRDYNGGAADIFIVKLDSMLTIEPIIPNLNVAPPSGHAPLTVQFTDLSHSLEPITSWTWDFDSDGTIDSNEPTPCWTYEEPGVYTVSLTVSNNSASKTKAFVDLIHVFDGESALYFPGEDCHVTSLSTTELNLREAVTMEAWINPAGWGNFATVIGKGNFSILLGGENGALVYHSLSVWHATDNGTPGFTCSQGSVISLNEWQHIAVSYDGVNNEIKLYVNGSLQELTFLGGQPAGNIKDNSMYDLIFGNSVTQGRPFDGAIDEIRLWNIVRSDAEIQETMNHYLRGDEPGLIGYWKMNEGNGNIIADNSGNGHDGNLHSVTWIQGVSMFPTSLKYSSDQVRPQQFVLFNNYPNPFNPATTIEFTIPKAAFIDLKIYNVNGKLVKTLTAASKNTGHYSLMWDGTDSQGQPICSGVYVCKLSMDKECRMNKMLLIK